MLQFIMKQRENCHNTFRATTISIARQTGQRNEKKSVTRANDEVSGVINFELVKLIAINEGKKRAESCTKRGCQP